MIGWFRWWSIFAAILLLAPATSLGHTRHDGHDDGPCDDAGSSGAVEDAARCRFRAEVERLKAIQARHQDRLLALEDVIGVGIGASEDGKRPIFVILVPADAQRPQVPHHIEGVSVRVDRREPIQLLNGVPDCSTPCHADQLPPPVEMGNSHGWVNGPACSLGFKACDRGTLQMVYVTNSHCNQFQTCSLAHVGNDHQHVGSNDDVGQSYLIGEIAGHAAPQCSAGANNYVDATKVDSPNELTSMALRDIGFPLIFPGDPLPGDPVQKSGRTTGFSEGTVTAVGISVDVPASGGFCCGALTMNDQIEWQPAPGMALQGGDSGSSLLSVAAQEQQRVVGLNFGQAGSFAYANRIDRVLSALNLTLDVITCFPECIFTQAAGSAAERADLVDLGHRFRNEVLQRTAVGRQLTQIYYQFSDEAVRIALTTPGLLDQTRRLLLELAPVLRRMVEFGEAEVGADEFAAVDQLLGGYAAEGSDALREAVAQVQTLIRNPSVQRCLGVVASPDDPRDPR
jgi:hypothetical protein